MAYTFGTGSGLVFVRSAFAQAQAYFQALGVVVGEGWADATKFGFPARPFGEAPNLSYRITDTPYVLALVRQADDQFAVLAFGPKNGGPWPALVLNPDGSYVLEGPVNPLQFGVVTPTSGVTIANARYFASEAVLVRQFDPSMVAADWVVVSIDRSLVATTTADGVIVDVTASLAEIRTVVNDAGALLASQIQTAILALQNSCADFHNLGRIDDYRSMLLQLQAASETINLNLVANLDLASYKQDLVAINALLSQITLTITQTVTINDTQALQAIYDFIQELDSCKIAVRDFHIAINSVAVLSVPQSLTDTANALRGFNSEVKCIADHLGYFATGVLPAGTTEPLSEFQLSAARQAEIAAAVASVNALASIGNADLTNIEAQAVKAFQDQATALASSVSVFDGVLAGLTSSLAQFLPPSALAAAQEAVRVSQAAAAARAARNP